MRGRRSEPLAATGEAAPPGPGPTRSTGATSPGGGHSHQPSAGYRDANGDRVSHPRQDRGPRPGAGQSARQAGHNSHTDSHGRNFGADGTHGWEWDEEEEDGQQE